MRTIAIILLLLTGCGGTKDCACDCEGRGVNHRGASRKPAFIIQLQPKPRTDE